MGIPFEVQLIQLVQRMDIMTYWRFLIATAIAGYLSISGLKKKSLSASGAAAAFTVGLITFCASYRFGLILIIFYYTGSKFTKLKENIKATLEDDYLIGGQRNYKQVFCNSLLAALTAVLYFVLIGEDTHVSFSSTSDFDIIDIFGYNMKRSRLASFLWCAYVAHFSCSAGDTWASEIGILSPSKPRLITKFFMVEVPPGTNGGMSILGTVSSAMGGLSMGLVFYIMSYISVTPDSYAPPQSPMILLGLICGTLGSIIDSLLGGTLQASYYSTERRMIVKVSANARKNDTSIIVISGIDILSNDMVNLLSIFFTMLVSVYISPPLFCALDSMHC
mmetsp:Transcript_5536/g.5717  ORF Transcript_5536/g.5717 Transcript_5536/m.5717 type:complete len:334 (-) Transcript_5536:50-1051(-)